MASPVVLKCDRCNEDEETENNVDDAKTRQPCKDCAKLNVTVTVAATEEDVTTLLIKAETETDAQPKEKITKSEPQENAVPSTIESIELPLKLEPEEQQTPKPSSPEPAPSTSLPLQSQEENTENKIIIDSVESVALSAKELKTEIMESLPTAHVDGTSEMKKKPAATKPEPPQESTESLEQAAAAAAVLESQPVVVRRSPKVTRSSINGARTPTLMKRLRKSPRSTRFKTKLNARSAANTTPNNNCNGQGSSSTVHGAALSMHSGKLHSKTGSGAGGIGSNSSAAARNRRALFKRAAQKTPKLQACTKFVKSVFYKGTYMQMGDIVNIVDAEQNVFYAQIRGLMVDEYCEKSAFLTWLIPTQDSPDPKEGFDPATYLIGPDEEISRKLCYLEFVMHAPSNYYYDRTTPFPLPDTDEYPAHRAGGYIWTRLPTIKREPRQELRTSNKA